MPVEASMWIAGRAEKGEGDSFHALEASTGLVLDPAYRTASAGQVERALAAADAEAADFAASAPEARAYMLDAIASAIMEGGDELIERAMVETGLPRPRLEGERMRTASQFRLFATHLREGDFARVRIDRKAPDRLPAPKPDLRMQMVPLGPVAVFGASNFPLAFSVAGGDTASALAAGCPVVVKGHPAHPGTSELMAKAVGAGIATAGFEAGIFSMLQDGGIEVGQALASDPRIKAVGFTGSRRGGQALIAVSNARPEPIPVYAEMSAVNPVLILPARLAQAAEDVANAFVGSLTLGSGQFCTNPGLVVAIEGEGLDRFLTTASVAVSAATPGPMLTPRIGKTFAANVATVAGQDGVEVLARGEAASMCGAASLMTVPAERFIANPLLHAEMFGPAALVVICVGAEQMAEVLASVEGQLTVAIHFAEADKPAVASLLPLAQRKAGRVLANGFGTGVEVSPAMVHGGPYPASSDSRSTSVGTLAIERFLRPVCLQDFPEELLPRAIRDANEWRLPRRVWE